jgi:hypothetical protein
LWDVSKRPGGKGTAAQLPLLANVNTIQDDRFTQGLERTLARTFNVQGPPTVHVTLKAEGVVELTGTVRSDRDKSSATLISEKYYIDLKPDQDNQVINNLQVTGGIP